MALELQIIRPTDFICVGPKGSFDLAASKCALAEVARACRKRGIPQALIDLRALHPGPKPVFSPEDLVALVNTFHEVGFTRQERLAVLYGSDPHHRARLFAFLSTMHGWSVRAFSDYEKAIHWLSGGQETDDDATSATAAKPIPVRKVKPAAKPAARPIKTKTAGTRSVPLAGQTRVNL